MNVTNSLTTKPEISSRSWVLGVLTIVYFSNYVDRTVVYLLQESIKAEFRLADWQVGLLGGTAFGLMYAICGVPIARLAERTNRVRLLTSVIVIWSGMTALCGAASSFAQLLMTRAGVAVGESGSAPASHSIITDYFPPYKRATAFSIYSLATPAGQAFAAVIGAMIASQWGWRLTFVIFGFAGLVGALLVLFTVKEPPRGHSDPKVTLEDNAPPRGSLVEIFSLIVRKKAVLHSVIGSTLGVFAYYGIQAFTMSYLVRKFEVPLSSAGLSYALVFGLATGVGLLAGGIGTDKLGAKEPRMYGWVPAACLAVACPLFITGFAQNDLYRTILFLFVPGMMAVAYIAPTYSILHNSFAAGNRATVIAVLFLCHSLIGLGLGPLILGTVSDALAANAFVDGDYVSLCREPGSAISALYRSCQSASATGLQRTLMLISFFYAWGAIHYLIAARSVERDSLLSLRR